MLRSRRSRVRRYRPTTSLVPSGHLAWTKISDVVDVVMDRFSYALRQPRGFEHIAQNVGLRSRQLAQAIEQSDEPQRRHEGGDRNTGIAALELAQRGEGHGQPGREILRRLAPADARDPDGLPDLAQRRLDRSRQLMEAFGGARHGISLAC